MVQQEHDDSQAQSSSGKGDITLVAQQKLSPQDSGADDTQTVQLDKQASSQQNHKKLSRKGSPTQLAQMSSSNQENQQNGAQQEMRTSLQGSQQNQNQFKQSSRTEGQISADEFDKVDSDRDKNAKVDNDLNK